MSATGFGLTKINCRASGEEGRSATLFLKIANLNRLSGLAVDRGEREYLLDVLWFGIWTAR